MKTLMDRLSRAALFAAALLGMACGGGGGGGPEAPATYDELMATGWAAFTAGDYATAASAFSGAASLDDAQAEPHSGLGWSRLYLADLADALQAFDEGTSRTGTAGIMADLHAGSAFAANALKDPTGADLANFSDSNDRIAEALAEEADWVFDRRPALELDDLLLLQAANHFALGEFDESLAAVQEVDSLFDADVGTAEGRAALAAGIEELTSLEF